MTSLDLLLQEKILVTWGTGFNWPKPDPLRIVTLVWAADLAAAIERLGNFLAGYRHKGRAYCVCVAHSHSHGLPPGPAPVGPIAAKIVVGLLIAIGVVVLTGAAWLWPSQQKVDIPLPFQNAEGGAVSTEAGHVLSTSAAICGDQSVGAVLTVEPVPAQGDDAHCVALAHRDRLWSERGRQHLAGVQRRRGPAPARGR